MNQRRMTVQEALQTGIVQNAIRLYRSGNIQGLEELAQNVCKEYNVPYDEAFNAVRQQAQNFNIR